MHRFSIMGVSHLAGDEAENCSSFKNILTAHQKRRTSFSSASVLVKAAIYRRCRRRHIPQTRPCWRQIGSVRKVPTYIVSRRGLQIACPALAFLSTPHFSFKEKTARRGFSLLPKSTIIGSIMGLRPIFRKYSAAVHP